MANKDSELRAAELLDEYVSKRLRGEQALSEDFLYRCPLSERSNLSDALAGLELTIKHHCQAYISEAFVDGSLAELQAIRRKKRQIAEWKTSLHGWDRANLSDPVKSLSDLMGFVDATGLSLPSQGGYQPTAVRYRGKGEVSAFNASAIEKARLTLLEGKIQAAAEATLRRAGIEQAPVDLYRIATSLYLHVQETRLDRVDGCIISSGDAGVILINNEIKNHSRRRFTLGHEIGHFQLHRNHRSHVDNDDTINDYLTREEEEANLFASLLLMPPSMVSRSYGAQKPSFELAELLQHSFAVSLSAALRRIVRMSDWGCALVVLKHGIVKWSARSEFFGGWILSRPHPASQAARLNDANPFDEEDDNVPIQAWIDTANNDERLIHEHSRRMGEGYVYSLLTQVFEQ